MTETTTLQDAYAPSIRRRNEIVARDYCGGTPVTRDPYDPMDEPTAGRAIARNIAQNGLPVAIITGVSWWVLRDISFTVNGQTAEFTWETFIAGGILIAGIMVAVSLLEYHFTGGRSK